MLYRIASFLFVGYCTVTFRGRVRVPLEDPMVVEAVRVRV
jgi:hypothetical protein